MCYTSFMEQIPAPENKRDIAVEALKNLGFENAEARKLLTEWAIEQEQKAESIGTREAQLDFEMERVQLYFDAGLQDEALQALNDVRDIAIEERADEQLQRISRKYQEFFEKLDPELAIEILTCDGSADKKLTGEQKEILMEQIEKDESAIYLAHLNFTESGIEPNESEKWWLRRFEEILLKTENPEIAAYILKHVASLTQADRERLDIIL